MIETILAIVGGCAGLVGLGISIRSERRATRAEKQAEVSAQRQLWTNVIMAAHELVTVNVFAEPMKPLLVRLRASGTELVDGLPEGKYHNIGEWLKHEHQRLTYALHYTYVKQDGKPLDPDNILDSHATAHLAAASLISNLRYFRKMNPGQQLDAGMAELTVKAKKDLAWLKPAVGMEIKDD